MIMFGLEQDELVRLIKKDNKEESERAIKDNGLEKKDKNKKEVDGLTVRDILKVTGRI